MIVRSVTAGFLLWAGLVSFVGARPSAAEDMKELVAPYLRARDAHAAGRVTAHAYGDPPRPTGSPVPYAGVSVMLVPYSQGLESELDGIKKHFRDSLTDYMAAATEVRAARTAYEQALLWVGGGELVRGDVTDGAGLVTLADMPVGEWLVLAWREEARPTKARVRPQDITGFRDVPIRTGYALVSYWRMRVQIRSGEVTSVDFNDRNVWITAVREDVHLIQGPPKKAEPRRSR